MLPHLPLLLRFLDKTVLDETAIIIIVKGLYGLLDRSVRQEDGFTPRPIVTPIPLAHHQALDGPRLEVAALGVTPMLRGSILIIGG